MGPRCLEWHTLGLFFGNMGQNLGHSEYAGMKVKSSVKPQKGPYTHQVYGFYAMQTVEHMHLAIRCAIFGDG